MGISTNTHSAMPAKEQTLGLEQVPPANLIAVGLNCRNSPIAQKHVMSVNL